MVGSILRVTDTLAGHIHAENKVHIGADPLRHVAALTARKINERLPPTPQSCVKEDTLLDPAIVEVAQALDHRDILLRP